jgi:hypothetical protein
MKKYESAPNRDGGITVLALLEGTTADEFVTEQAAGLAARGQGNLVLLRSLPLVERSEPRSGGGAPPIQPWELMRAQKAAAGRRLRDLSQGLGVPTEVRVRFGDSAETVAEVASGRKVDLVVAAVPSRRRLPWLKRDFSLLAEVTIPVTLVSPPGIEAGSTGRGPSALQTGASPN